MSCKSKYTLMIIQRENVLILDVKTAVNSSVVSHQCVTISSQSARGYLEHKSAIYVK